MSFYTSHPHPPPVSSPARAPAAVKRKAVYRHEPYSGAVIIPSLSSELSPRVICSANVPMVHHGVPSFVGHKAQSLAGFVVTPNSHLPSHHSRRATLSSISTASIEGPITPSSTSKADAVCCMNSIGASVDEAERQPEVRVSPHPLAVSTLTAALTYSSHCNPAVLSAACESIVIPAGAAVEVGFKYGKHPFLTTFPLQPGELVVVEGDRGIDMGVAQALAPIPRSEADELPRVLRRPTAQDEEMHRQRFHSEVLALHRVREACSRGDHGASFSPNAIRDVMFQLDSKKITLIIHRANNKFFFDFRKFQREVFNMYRCRVWFSYLDEIQQTTSTEGIKRLGGAKGGPQRRAKGKGRIVTAVSSERRTGRTSATGSNAALLVPTCP